jgi:hypothetical protein
MLRSLWNAQKRNINKMLPNNYGTTQMKEGVEVLIEQNQTVGLLQRVVVRQNQAVGFLLLELVIQNGVVGFDLRVVVRQNQGVGLLQPELVGKNGAVSMLQKPFWDFPNKKDAGSIPTSIIQHD